MSSTYTQQRLQFEQWWNQNPKLGFYSIQGVAWRTWLAAQGLTLDLPEEAARLEAQFAEFAAIHPKER